MSSLKDNLLVASALIASSVFLQVHNRPGQELITECICWCLILVGGKLFSRFRHISSRPFNATELGIIAFGMIISCLSSSVQKTIWSTVRISHPCSSSRPDLIYLFRLRYSDQRWLCLRAEVHSYYQSTIRRRRQLSDQGAGERKAKYFLVYTHLSPLLHSCETTHWTAFAFKHAGFWVRPLCMLAYFAESPG